MDSKNHTENMMKLLNGKVDAITFWSSLNGNYDEGYSFGGFTGLVKDKKIDMKDIRIIWQSSLIPNPPVLASEALPVEAREIFRDFMIWLHEGNNKCHQTVNSHNHKYIPINHDFYNGIIQLKKNQ